MSIVLSTENLNRYGYRVLTKGIDLKAFKKNPIMFYDHKTYSMFPIGKWENLRVEDNKLIGDPIFDEDDETALMLKKKFDKGMLNAASISVSVKAYSDEPKHLLKGQTGMSVTKCELREVSIVSIPGNSEAVRLSLSDDDTAKGPPELNLNLNSKQKMDKVKLQLGLAPDSNEDQVVEAIKRLQTEKKELFDSRVKDQIEAGKKAGIINDDNEQAYTASLNADYDSASQILSASIAKANESEETEQTLSGAIKDAAGKAKDQDWTFDDYQKKDPKALLSLKEKEPKKYKQMYLAYQANLKK